MSVRNEICSKNILKSNVSQPKSTKQLQHSETLVNNEVYGRPSPPKIQGCQIDQQIQRWCKDQLQDSIANKGMAWPNYRRFSFPS